MDSITFIPLYMERVWGGRELENTYKRCLPAPHTPFGESWEIVDREDAQSVVHSGPFAGKTLHALWSLHREELFGLGYDHHTRFPILIKILDARDDLSIQVHPPAHLATQLGGEPKTEMWFIANCAAGAKLYVGLKQGVTRKDFESAIQNGCIAQCVHSITPHPGDSIFIPSGRLHAIGAGFLIHEIQQNSDTTYRVFDWNRLGLDGKVRDLHVDQSLASIDFDDFEPNVTPQNGTTLARCPHFQTDRVSLEAGDTVHNPDPQRFSIISIVEGALNSESGHAHQKGDFLLVPRNAAPLAASEKSIILQITLPLA